MVVSSLLIISKSKKHFKRLKLHLKRIWIKHIFKVTLRKMLVLIPLEWELPWPSYLSMFFCFPSSMFIFLLACYILSLTICSSPTSLASMLAPWGQWWHVFSVALQYSSGYPVLAQWLFIAYRQFILGSVFLASHDINPVQIILK